jgi:hypothetical protein
LDIWRSRKAWVIAATALGSATAGGAAFVTNFETLSSHATDYLKTRDYIRTLKSPYPSILDEKTVSSWNVGTLELATYQIRGYLGQLKSSPSWIRQCLTTPEIFPDNYASQFNDHLELPESNTDSQNIALLSRRIDAIEIQNDPLLRINDPYVRLLERASSTLLHRYKETEIAKLENTELYLLRNSIYMRHGRPFDTAKLEKYANRKGWPSLGAAYKPTSVTPVELCNALYLNALHASRELGAVGRGILIRNQNPSPTADLLKASLCSCLGQPKVLVECRENSGASEQDEFRDYVDLVLDFSVADANAVEWTFLDPRNVISADLGDLKPHMDTFLSSAVHFNAGVQSALKAHSLPFAGSHGRKNGPFWGAQVSFVYAGDGRRARVRSDVPERAFDQYVRVAARLAGSERTVHSEDGETGR